MLVTLGTKRTLEGKQSTFSLNSHAKIPVKVTSTSYRLELCFAPSK